MFATRALAAAAGKVAIARTRRPIKSAIDIVRRLGELPCEVRPNAFFPTTEPRISYLHLFLSPLVTTRALQTESAAERLKNLLAAKPDAVGIRVGIKTRGCNGQSYTMNYAAEKSAKDEEVVAKGVRVLIEPAALMKVVGTTMDWKEDDLSAQFVFSNPNAKSVCGCGESFNT